eukprot:432465_1
MTMTDMTELTHINDISVDDNATTITMNTMNTIDSIQDPHHVHSLSAELKSFQNGQQMSMNAGITDSTGTLAKDSMLTINRTSTTEAEEQIFQRGQSMKSIASDVSGMSSISSYQPKFNSYHSQQK